MPLLPAVLAAHLPVRISRYPSNTHMPGRHPQALASVQRNTSYTIYTPRCLFHDHLPHLINPAYHVTQTVPFSDFPFLFRNHVRANANAINGGSGFGLSKFPMVLGVGEGGNILICDVNSVI